MAVVLLAVLLTDQLSKALALRYLAGVPTTPIWPGVFHLTLVVNSGVAFGLFRGYGLLVTLVTLGLLALLLRSSLRAGAGPRTRWMRLGLGLILGGAGSNLLDRVRFGGVVDFLDFRVWPVFNVADSCVTIGAILLAWVLTRAR